MYKTLPPTTTYEPKTLNRLLFPAFLQNRDTPCFFRASLSAPAEPVRSRSRTTPLAKEQVPLGASVQVGEKGAPLHPWNSLLFWGCPEEIHSAKGWKSQVT